MKRSLLIPVFWAALIGFFAWDWAHSEPINLHEVPPVIALGSGQVPTGAHCAATF